MPDIERGATSRRGLFAGAGAVGAGALLAACGGEPTDGDGGTGPPAGPTDDANGGTGPPADPTDDANGGDNGGDNGDQPAGVLAGTSEVEVGGGVINAEAGVVVTQPTAGNFRGFSAACTHQRCTVSSVGGGTINCACHGAQYSIEDGSVVRAAPELTPQTQDPLAEVDVTLDGQMIVRA